MIFIRTKNLTELPYMALVIYHPWPVILEATKLANSANFFVILHVDTVD